MARFRARRSRGGFKRRARGFARKAGVGRSANLIQMDAMLYGAARQYLANALTPVTSMIPFGNYADEIGCGLAAWLIAKNTSGMVRDVAIKGLVVENARIGEQIAGGFLGGGNSTTNGYMYG